MSAPAINFNNLWKPFSVAAAICFLYANVLVKLGRDWWTDDNYSHGLLIPFVIGYIVWLEFEPLKKAITKFVYLLLAVLLIGGVFINWFEQRGEVAPQRKSLSELPATLGKWRQKGAEIRFDEATEKVLRASDYTMRDYASPDNRVANLYVGYYTLKRQNKIFSEKHR